jgi:hypothetical protein
MTLEESILRLSSRRPDWKKNGHFPDKVKVTFSHFGYRKLEGELINPAELDVTDLSLSDEGLEIVFERDGLSGVQQEVSFPQEFVLEARDFLASLYTHNRQYATCRINIFRRDGVDVKKYEHIRSFLLDFDTIKIKDDRVEITARDEGLNTYIKSSGNTKIDIPVRDKLKDGVLEEAGVAEDIKVRYNRIYLHQKVVLIPVAEGTEYSPESFTDLYFYPYIYLSSANLVNQDMYDFRTQEQDLTDHLDTGHYFHMAKKNETVHLSFKIKLERDTEFGEYSTGFYFALYKENIYAISPQPVYLALDYGIDTETGQEFTLQYDDDIVMKNGDILAIVQVSPSTDRQMKTFTITNERAFEFTFLDKGPMRFIDVINPETLLNRILSVITGGRDYTGRIEWDDEEAEYMSRLIAAESVRQLEDATIHVSFDEFSKWMKVKGFEYYLEGNEIIFVKRRRLFRRYDVVLDIPGDQVAGLVTEADRDNMFTGINIGYKAQEYDENLNGRYEVNGTFTYATNYLAQSDNVLDLISPFRGDNMGLELLCWKTSQESKDTASTKSDNDIFEFVVYKPSVITPGPYYYTYDAMKTYSEDIYLFNTPINPYFLALENLPWLGVGTDKLFFKATTSYRNARFEKYDTPEINLYGDIPAAGRLFSPFTYDLATDSEIKLPVGAGLNGVINFQWKGKPYAGYLKKGTENLSKGTEKQLILMAIDN